MQKRFYIAGGRGARPAANRVVFCDGSADQGFRPDIDIELSHWIPNRTPRRFKADTSTEICMRFVAEGGDAAEYDLVINNHIDVDGVLSVLTLVDTDLALAHRNAIIQAAEIGDFWGWGDRTAQVLYETLALEIARLRASKTDPQEIYSACFERARSALSGHERPEVLPGLEALADSLGRIDRGVIPRTELNTRFVHYAISREIAEAAPKEALRVPAFSVSLTRQGLLAPQARAHHDEQKVQLVSVESKSGWYYDLWYPGYVWAETPNRWRPPGIRHAGDSNTHDFKLPALDRAVDDLRREEPGAGQWITTTRFTPFASVPGRNFPVVLSVLRNREPVPSALPPALVAERLAQVFAGE